MAYCKLCGTDFQTAAWQTKWRAIYCFGSGHDAYLSEVGDFRKTEGWLLYSIPDDQTLPFPDAHLKLLASMGRKLETVQGLLHEKCWVILRQYINAEELDLKQLFHALSNISYDQFYPLYYYRLTESGRGINDPSKEPKMPSLKQCSSLACRSWKKVNFRRWNNEILPWSNSSDIFRRLPLELIEHISKYLSTADFLCFHQASRAASAVFHSESFWESRFYLGGERGFFHYLLRDVSRGDEPSCWDWRHAYHHTRKRLNKSGTHRCRRILWQRCEWLKDRYMSTRAEKFGRLSAKEKQLANKLIWVNERDRSPFDMSQGALSEVKDVCFEQFLLKYESLCQIGISVFEQHSKKVKDYTTFIAGFELISKKRDQPNKIFGYRIPGKQVYIDLESWEDLRGFEYSMSREGIHAIRLCHIRTSHWVGSPKPDETKWEGLVSDREIAGIWGAFDNCKMVKLAIGNLSLTPSRVTIADANSCFLC